MFESIRPFRYWVQKALPLVYDDSLSYYELLCKVVDYINNLTTDVNQMITIVNRVEGIIDDTETALQNALETGVSNFETAINNGNTAINNAIANANTSIANAIQELTEYRNNYFENLDVQNEINNKLDAMVLAGTMQNIVANVIGENSTPVIVDSVDEMTVRNKLYVLSLNNAIYQWDGSEQAFVATTAHYGGYSFTPTVVDYTFGFNTTSNLNGFNNGNVIVIIGVGESVHESFPSNISSETEPMLLEVIDNGETVFQRLTTSDDIWRRIGTHNGTFNPWHSVV